MRPGYGVILLPYSVSYQRILETTRHAEALGFDSVWISDHLQRGLTPTLECWSTISALIASTKRVRLGSLATCNSFRNPLLLAKMVSTIYEISPKRVELAIGLGYDPKEHAAGGFPFLSSDQRIEKLEETLQIIQSLWTRKKTTFKGKYWKIENAVCEPKPSSLPRIWVAGRNKKLFEIASKYAQGVNILPYSGTMENRRISSFEELEQIVDKIDSYGSLAKSLYCGDGGLVIGKDDRDYARKLKRAAYSQGLSEAQLTGRLRNLSILYGTVGECKDRCEKLARIGFEELMIIFSGWQKGNYESMDLFAKEMC